MSSVPPEAPVEVLLRSGRTSFEFVQSLGPARNGELVLVRRRYEENFGGYSVIKRPRPEGGEEARRRLMDEARLTAYLSHPNLLSTCHHKGPDDTPHLVMEHVEGYRLETLLATSARTGHSFSTTFACYVVSELADALHHAHSLVDEHGRDLSAVHRDVTPHNVLLGSHGEVKLLDFGAAWSRLAGRVASEGPAVQGSLAYAAPEHVQQLALDGRADLFSLGIILLQLLTGRHLFPGAERFDARQRQPSLPEDPASRLCAQDLADRIREYSEKDLKAATRAVPEALRPLIHQMLAPDRGDRFPTCAAFSDIIRTYLREGGKYFGRHEVIVEVTSLRYLATRMDVGDESDEAVYTRHVPDMTPRSGPRWLIGHRAARPRGAPRRR
jgi:eukaryotic-like serine/threonine-protein kinase